MNWKTVEVSAYSYYVDRGYRVFVPLVTNEGYDFLAVSDDKALRVNAKLAYLKDRSQPDSWAISTTPRGLANPDTVDVFLVWMPDREHFIEVPGTHFVGSASTSRRIAKKYKQGNYSFNEYNGIENSASVGENIQS